MKVLLFVPIVIGVLLAPAASVSAEHTTFKQQILPFDCVFETVSDGSGTINYLTPAECGQIIPPEDPGTDPTEGTSTPGGEPSPNTTFVRYRSLPDTVLRPSTDESPTTGFDNPNIETITQGSLFINDHDQSQTTAGYNIVVQVGSILYYRPLDNDSAYIRTLTIQKITADGVSFTVQPNDLSLRALLGIPLGFDRQQNGPAIKLTVKSINAGGTATLNVQLLQTEPTSSRQSIVKTASIVGVSLLLLGALHYAPQLLRSFRSFWRR
jgi:hypothetical protein